MILSLSTETAPTNLCKSEKSTARGAERAGERAEAGGDTSSRTHAPGGRGARGEVSDDDGGDDDDDDDDAKTPTGLARAPRRKPRGAEAQTGPRHDV